MNKRNRLVRLGIWIVALSFLLSFFFNPTIKEIILVFLYGDGSSGIIARSWDKTPLDNYFWEHLKIIRLTVVVISLIACFMLVYGVNRWLKMILKLILIFWGIMTLFIILVDWKQALIIIFPILSSFLWVSRMTHKEISLIDKINITFLILCVQIILMTEILSLLNGINATNFLLTNSLWLIITLRYTKDMKACISADIQQLRFSYDQLLERISAHRLIVLFLCAILMSFLWRMILIAYWPANYSDSMEYHLSRVAYWMQNHSLKVFYTPNLRQVCFPFNSEILFLWTMISSRMDYLCGFVMFISYVLAGSLLYKCCREYMKADVIPSLLVMLVWYCLPQPVLASTSTGNDLLVGYLIMFSLVYFLAGIKQGRGVLMLSALALAMAIGTKATALFYCFPFFFLIILYFVKKAIRSEQIVLWILMFAVSWLAVGSYSFIQNYIEFSNIFGPDPLIHYHKISHPSLKSCLSNFSQTVFNLLTNHAGANFYIYRLAGVYNQWAAKIGKVIFKFFHIPVNVPGAFMPDDIDVCIFPRGPGGNFLFSRLRHKFSLDEYYAFFGVIGMILFFLMIDVLFRKILSSLLKKGGNYDNKYFSFAFLGFVYLILLSYFKIWDLGISRFLVPMVLISMPLLLIIFQNNSYLARGVIVFMIVYFILLLIPSTFLNRDKPLTMFYFDDHGYRVTLLNKDRIGLRYLKRFEAERFIRKYYSIVPSGSRVGTILSFWEWDYPLFGEGLTRTIIPLDAQITKKQEFDFILVDQKTLDHSLKLKELILNDYSEAVFLGKTVSSNKMVLYKRNVL